MMELREALESIIAFRDERDWAQFHTPRNLAAAIAIEAAELQEVMLWMSDGEVDLKLSEPEVRDKVRDEMADVLIFTFLLAHRLGVDPLDAIQRVDARVLPASVERCRLRHNPA